MITGDNYPNCDNIFENNVLSNDVYPNLINIKQKSKQFPNPHTYNDCNDDHRNIECNNYINNCNIYPNVESFSEYSTVNYDISNLNTNQSPSVIDNVYNNYDSTIINFNDGITGDDYFNCDTALEKNENNIIHKVLSNDVYSNFIDVNQNPKQLQNSRNNCNDDHENIEHNDYTTDCNIYPSVESSTKCSNVNYDISNSNPNKLPFESKLCAHDNYNSTIVNFKDVITGDNYFNFDSTSEKNENCTIHNALYNDVYVNVNQKSKQGPNSHTYNDCNDDNENIEFTDYNNDYHSSLPNNNDNHVTEHPPLSLSCIALNVGGFITKSLYPDFIEFINKHDIICISESKLSYEDTVNIEGFTSFYKNRLQFKRKSGGILILIRNKFVKYVKIYEEESYKPFIEKEQLNYYVFTQHEVCKNALFFSLHDIVFDKKVLFCAVYIEPDSSNYFNKNAYNELCETLLLLNFDSICLLGDFNSRCGNLKDNLDKNDYSDGLVEVVQTDLLPRTSKDSHTNNMGHELISFCKSMQLFICNGRVGSDMNVGDLTCKNASIVDYVIMSSDMFKNLMYFHILDFNELYSDVHCPINIVFDISHNLKNEQNNTCVNKENISNSTSIKWDASKTEELINCIQDDRINSLHSNLNALLSNIEKVDINDIDRIVTETSSLMTESASKVNIIKDKKMHSRHRKKKYNQPWFNSDCREKRKIFLRAKRKDFKGNMNLNIKLERKRAAKNYKYIIKKSVRNYQTNLANHLRNIKSSDPKMYWNYLKDTKYINDNTNQPDCETFAKMFKDIGNSKEKVCTNKQSNEENINFMNFINVKMYYRDTSLLNDNITHEEVIEAIHKLKNNKSHGLDNILNEFLKVTSAKLINIFVDLFNLILATGLMPTTWSIGVIRPIYKNKGNRDDPNNYRGITILSCFGKLFTSVLNNRLCRFIEQFDIIGNEQSGFRKGYSTNDNIFILYGIINILLSNRKRLYCAFLDYEKAFDKIDRIFLWQKLLNENISGKVLVIIKNIYESAKSCVKVGGEKSEFFKIHSGVRQGENLSPILFSLFLNDMKSYLSKDMEGLNSVINQCNLCDKNEIDSDVFLNLFVLLYADDTVIFSEKPEELQMGLNSVSNYCHLWNLKLNTCKCKIMIFSRGKVRKYPDFFIDNSKIEVVRDFTYLGLKLNYNNRFNITQKDLNDRALRAMFLLMKKTRKLSLPIDLVIDLFDNTVLPVLTYGCEVWGFHCLDLIDRLQLRFYKSILKLRASTPTFMVYGEVGKYPVELHIKLRMLLFWQKLVSEENRNNLSSVIYRVLFTLHKNNLIECNYISCIEQILIEIGLPYLWRTQNADSIGKPLFKNYIKTKLQDLFIQQWHSRIDNGGIFTIYRMLKSNFSRSPYLQILNNNCAIAIARFFTTNNNLPVNTERYKEVERKNRLCNKCSLKDIGDEFHYIFCCPFFDNKRKETLPKTVIKKPNSISFSTLLNGNDRNQLLKLKHFLCYIQNSLEQ